MPLLLTFPYSWASDIPLQIAAYELYSATFQVGEQEHHFSESGAVIFQFICEFVYLIFTGLIVAASVMAITTAAQNYKRGFRNDG